MSDREKIIKLLREGERFNLVSHQFPDGDNIGSLLALGEALERAGKEVQLFVPGGVPRRYRFLKGSEKIQPEMRSGQDWPMVVLDSSDLERTANFQEQIRQAKIIINIDHHVTNERFGTLNLVDPGAAATGEIIYLLLKEMEAEITRDMALALYVAISTDTGSFKFENTTPRTHRVAAELLEYKLNPAVISQRVFDERPYPFFRLLERALAGLELHHGGKIACITLSSAMLEECGALPEDLEGLINYTRNIEGVELGIMFFIESPEEVKVGFRTKTVDAARLAGLFNGGGHPRAAGCRLRGRPEEIKERVLREAAKLLEEGSRSDKESDDARNSESQ